MSVARFLCDRLSSYLIINNIHGCLQTTEWSKGQRQKEIGQVLYRLYVPTFMG